MSLRAQMESVVLGASVPLGEQPDWVDRAHAADAVTKIIRLLMQEDVVWRMVNAMRDRSEQADDLKVQAMVLAAFEIGEE